jgi:hypothetical protein
MIINKLLEAEKKLKLICIIVESQVIAHDTKPGFVTFVVYAEFRKINVDNF